MRTRTRWLLAGVIFAVVEVVWVALAWGGDNFSLVMLGLTALFMTGMMVVNGIGWRRALDGWDRSNRGWERTIRGDLEGR